MMFEALIARSSFGRAVLLIHRLAGLIWIPLTAVGLAWLLSLTSLFGWLDTKMRDVQAMFAAPSIASPDVLVVDIDDASLSHLRDALGSWPYARDKYAMVVDYLNELGARAVVFDIVLSERRDGDEQLQHAIERYGNVVLAASGRDDAGAGDLAPELLGLTWNIPATLPTPRWLGAELPLRRFTAPRNSIASAIGVVSATPDSSDGLLRRLPLFQRFQGLALPTLPLATLFGNATPPAVRFDGERVRIGNYVLPVDAQGRVCLGYARNAKTALEVLPFERLAGAMLGESGRALDPATIRGRIVIIGSSAFLSDRVATPVGQLTGSYALGLATAMIAGGQLMSPPQSAWSAILLVIAVLPVFSLLAWPAGGSPTIVVSTLSALVCIEAIQLGLLALDRQESAALLPVAIAVIGGLLMSGRQTWLARAQQEARIDAVTHTDALTGLPNRVAFQESLRAAIATAEAEGRSLSLLVLGIDHFQMINDGMGHAAGDELLQALTERLDASRGWSRLGGDEYALIFHGRAVDALEFAHRALRSLKAPFGVAGSSVHITAGVGIAHFPQDGRNEVGLRQSADVALHQAKSLGEGVVREFVAEQGQNVKDQMLLQSELHRAVINGELTLYCQPQIEIAGGRIVAAEFLVRWNHPVRGLLVPAQFIPFAEKSNLILEIDEWVLRESCRQIKAWHDSGLSHLTLGAVNLSARQFQQSDLPAQVERVLAETGLAPRFLELEITESLAMSDPEHTTRTLQALAEMGVALAVDDFGTGYSSLAYLKRFPIDIVKIDRAFVRDIEKEGLDAKLCAGVIDLAHRLEFDTIAEGVETVGQLERLAEFGCKKAQGYLIGRPIPASQMALVEGRRAGHPVIQRGDNASSLKVS